MPAIDIYKTIEEAWAEVHQLLGDKLRSIRLAVKNKQDLWLYEVEKERGELIDRLGEIAMRLAEDGHTDDGKKITDIWRLVIKSDLTKQAAFEAIHELANDLSELARAKRQGKIRRR